MTHPFISLILLGGGKGSRMKESIPKQFLPLKGKPLILHSFEVLQKFSFLSEVIIVSPREYDFLFPMKNFKVHFSEPGVRRQDSLCRGMEKISPLSDLVCIHDAARPFLEEKPFLELIQMALLHEAATLAFPVRYTIKEGNSQGEVVKTLTRETLWEIQTPQAIKTSLLKEALLLAEKNQWEVTDDVSLIELMGKKVKLVTGFSDNIKVTYPNDLFLAEAIYEKRKKEI
jgi:2-C-methyl-D-erythritol 4-phosphate cytidylyltransferase